MQGVGCFTDAKGICELQFFVAQEGILGAESRLEGGLDIGRVDGDDGDSAVGDFGGLMELDQFRQLKPSLGSPGTSVKGKNQRRTFCEPFD